MEINVIGFANAKAAGKVEVKDEYFTYAFNEPLIHQVVTAHLAGARAGTHAQKTRAEVSGGGIKPWRQKGTGRARAGSIRSPLWRTGGVTFAAKPRDYSQKVNRKMYRHALCSILSELVRQERLLVVDEVKLAGPKTRELVEKLKSFAIEKNALIVTEAIDDDLLLASRNIPNVDWCTVKAINPVNLVAFDKILITAPALKQLEEQLG